ncbi:MAG: hypothetical protein H7Z13_18825 [Ferruginibacter sp.]|nr:hypothetical protein [Ferruginibacter sp.]
MKKGLAAVIFIIALTAFINTEKQNDPIFDQLHALEGKWIMKTKKGAIGEEWKKINKDYLQNRGFMIRGNDTITTEKVALRCTKEGIFYTSTVEDQNNRQPTAFRLTSVANNIFVFENPQHDYPKRISYSFITKDSLYAWIDDGKIITEKKSTFRYSRQK